MISGGGPAGLLRSRPPVKQTKQAAGRRLRRRPRALRQPPQFRGDFPVATGKIKDVSGGVPIQGKRPGRARDRNGGRRGPGNAAGRENPAPRRLVAAQEVNVEKGYTPLLRFVNIVIIITKFYRNN